MPYEQPNVQSAVVIAMHLVDMADAIDLSSAEALWHQQQRPAAIRSKLASTPPKAMAFGVPPVVLRLDPLDLPLLGTTYRADATVRLYDFGAVAFSVQIPVTSCSWISFSQLVNAVDALLGPGADSAVWTQLLEHVRAALLPALTKPSPASLHEDYLLGIVHAFDETIPVSAMHERIDLVPLLSGEQRPLSEQARRDLLQQRFSYYADDLVVITWDRAFIYEPRGDSDVTDILEVANAQLLEMRFYDELLDAELPRMYDMVEAAYHAGNPLGAGARHFADLARKLYTLVAEVTEITEKVDNALQVTEDVYLARVYAAALDLFRVRHVSAAVDRKLAIIRDTYAALYEEASGKRAELLELAIIVLIVVEIVIAIIRH
ncbi:hypothetical protein [Dyella nitratireducens]|uniref:DUF155 domain-containing protein n=1 Tax=Dyella nitratireducens TaxID=1849580 RepID=A0ABQ1GR47_9GAMM|nr:hypothetical protein [Dyella nitratireducens]GGA48768.1 hypothetical protein GCM10010981_42570 [Dyella nitratireducens]GLQ42266.1 hypothetical protein GCM10007902_21160 [Dyella nitratireducens]